VNGPFERAGQAGVLAKFARAFLFVLPSSWGAPPTTGAEATQVSWPRASSGAVTVGTSALPLRGAGGVGFIPEAVKRHKGVLVWGQPYDFVEIKSRKEMSWTGNLTAMIDYVERYGGEAFGEAQASHR